MMSPLPKGYDPRVFQALTFHDAVERFGDGSDTPEPIFQPGFNSPRSGPHSNSSATSPTLGISRYYLVMHRRAQGSPAHLVRDADIRERLQVTIP